ncbi:MAG: TonB family protein, partial [Kofleriaceae bacterium]
LNNLAQLASDKPAISAPSSQSSGGAGHATGAAGGEGSGLIDIRSMASAYMGGGGASMGKVQTASAIGSIDDLPVFGGGGFSEPAVLVPTVSRASNNKMMYMMIAAVSLLAVVAIIMVVILMKGNKTQPAQVASADTGSAKPENAGDKTPDKVADTAKGSDTTGVATATGSGAAKVPDTTDTAKTPEKTPDTTKPPEKTVAKTPDKTTSKPHTTTTSSRPNVTASKPDRKPETTTTTASKPDTGGGGCDEVSCVLNNYEGSCCSKFKKGGGSKPSTGGSKPAAGGGGDLPDGLDRSMISTGIGNVKARVSSCGDKSSAKGKVKVHVKVGGDGRVSNVTVESSPDAGLGSCVAAAVQKASFSKTQNGGSFSYPFVF